MSNGSGGTGGNGGLWKVLLALGTVGVGLYLIGKMVKAGPKTNPTILVCGNCEGVLIGRPPICPHCGSELAWPEA